MGRYLPWIIAALVLVGLLFAMRNCAAQRKEVTTPTATAPAINAPRVTAPTVTGPAAPNATVNLPGGTAINVPQGSIGYNLANYLGSDAGAPKTFVFDNLNYDTASSTLTPASQPTVTAIASILKAYPNTLVKVVGFTDNQGAPASNQALSEQRAATVKSQLVAAGVPADHVQTAGMGQQNPVADNNTDAGRAANRRTELVVMKK